MTEAEFRSHLEFRLCRELAGQSDNSGRFLGCLRIGPEEYEEYVFDSPEPSITRRAWIVASRSAD
jgi:hypothetical protein